MAVKKSGKGPVGKDYSLTDKNTIMEAAGFTKAQTGEEKSDFEAALDSHKNNVLLNTNGVFVLIKDNKDGKLGAGDTVQMFDSATGQKISKEITIENLNTGNKDTRIWDGKDQYADIKYEKFGADIAEVMGLYLSHHANELSLDGE